MNCVFVAAVSLAQLISAALKQRGALVVTLVLLASTSNTVEAAKWISPDKSPSDSRDYRVITLRNQLQVMLVSDPVTDKAAAALDIAVGSGADPQGYEGLAHFLEHMLFLGTTKYPDAGAYQAFIQQHGGNHNAYTSFDHTNYFFDIEASALEPALDRFASQFVSPLFNETYVEREKNAVHSEFTAKLKDDSRRYFSAVKESMNPAHPYSRFSVGNLETLANRDNTSIREVLLEFYEKNYSANRMKLVILGKEPLDELEQLAKDKFSAIKNRRLPALTYTQPLFLEEQLPSLQQIEPLMNKRSLTLTFPVPSAKAHYDSKPLYYLANIIGHEGNGSLLSYLKARGWVDSLSAGSGLEVGTQATFDIGLNLTPDGQTHWQEVVKTVFVYLDMLKTQPLCKHCFNEQKQMLELSFNYLERSEPMHYVTMLASQLHEVPARRILKSGFMMSTFKPELIKKYLGLLNENNLLVTLMAPGVASEQRTRWYETPYALVTQSAQIRGLSGKHTGQLPFRLPDPNPFIPEKLAMVEGGDVRIPELLDLDEGFLSWYAKDTSFQTPKADIFVNFRSPIANNTARHHVMTALMASLINDNLNEFAYPAYLAGLSYQLYPHVRGISVKISGYSDKQNLLLTEILSTLKYSAFVRARFDIYKQNLQRSLENSKKQKPYQQAIAKTSELLVSPSWSDEEKLRELESINFEELVAFRTRWLQALDVLMLQNGNLNRSTALNHGAIVKQLITEQAQFASVSRSQVAKLKKGTQGFELQIDHPDSSLVLYYQGENKSYREQARYLLLTQIISSPFYEQLRTEKQMGYIVFASPYSLFDHPGIAFIVQSPAHSPSDILQASQQFFADHLVNITKMGDAEYAQHIKGIISKLEEKEHTISDRSNRYWIELDRDNATYDWREQIVASLKQLSKAEFVKFFEEALVKQSNALVVFNQGKQLTATADTKPAIKLFSAKQALW